MRIALFLAIVVAALFHFLTIGIYPEPFVDEAWMLARTWAFKQNSIVFGTFDSGVFDRLPGHERFFPWLPNFFWYLVVKFQEVPQLYTVRWVSLAFGAVILLCTYSLSKSLSDKRCAILSLTLLAFSTPFLFSAHIVRFDIIAAAFGYGALAIQAGNKKGFFITALTAGLLAGLACEIHLHSVIFVLPLLLLGLISRDTNAPWLPAIFGILLGLALGLVIYLCLHVFPNPEEYFTLQLVAFAPTHMPPITAGSVAVILDAFRSFFLGLENTHVIAWLFFPIVMFALATEPKGQKTLLIGCALILSFVLLIRSKMHSYYILIEPVIAIMLAHAFFICLQKQFKVSFLSKALPALLFLFFILNVSKTALQIDPQERLVFEQRENQLAQHINSSDVLMGPQSHWFKFYKNKFYSWENLIFYGRYSPTSSLEDAFLQFKPTVFIAGPPFTDYLSDDNANPSAYMQISKNDFEKVIEKYSIKNIVIPRNAYHKAVTLYWFNWERR